MIDFKWADYNLSKIDRHTGFLRNQFIKDFDIYGLSDKDNPMVKISYDFNKNSLYKRARIRQFFKNNNIEVEFQKIETEKVFIGLRKDLRKHVVLCSAIVQTIVFYIDGELKLDNYINVPGIPYLS
jgi:hypothetical protein